MNSNIETTVNAIAGLDQPDQNYGKKYLNRQLEGQVKTAREGIERLQYYLTQLDQQLANHEMQTVNSTCGNLVGKACEIEAAVTAYKQMVQMVNEFAGLATMGQESLVRQAADAARTSEFLSKI